MNKYTSTENMLIVGCDNEEGVYSRRQKQDEQTLKRKLENNDNEEHVDLVDLCRSAV